MNHRRFVTIVLLAAALGCTRAPGGAGSSVRAKPQPDGEADAAAAFDGPGARPDTAPDAGLIVDRMVDEVAVDSAIDAVPPERPREPSDACLRTPEDVAIRNGQREYVDMIVRGAGLTRYQGQRIIVYTVDYRTMRPLGYGSAVIRDGAFELRFPDGYHRFTYQPVLFFLDVNDDGLCQVATGDVALSLRSNAHNSNGPIEVDVGVVFRLDVDGGEPWHPSDPKVCDVMNACH